MSMTPENFIIDLERKPEALTALARTLESGAKELFAQVPRIAAGPMRQVLFLGMGSSRFAAMTAAYNLRKAGIPAAAEYASAPEPMPAAPDTLVVVISATGGSVETNAALERYRGQGPLVVITNRPDRFDSEGITAIVPMLAATEISGIACRTFQHTGLMLAALQEHLLGTGASGLPALAQLTQQVATASADLLDRRDEWLPMLEETMNGPDGVVYIAPVDRNGSSLQSALMMREGPRRESVGCETGDWSHIDLYTAKTRDYRAVLYAGSHWDAQLMDWMRQRNATVAAVGPAFQPADEEHTAFRVRYEGDTDQTVARYSEVLVGELLAHRVWPKQQWWQEEQN